MTVDQLIVEMVDIGLEYRGSQRDRRNSIASPHSYNSPGPAQVKMYLFQAPDTALLVKCAYVEQQRTVQRPAVNRWEADVWVEFAADQLVSDRDVDTALREEALHRVRSTRKQQQRHWYLEQDVQSFTAITHTAVCQAVSRLMKRWEGGFTPAFTDRVDLSDLPVRDGALDLDIFWTCVSPKVAALRDGPDLDSDPDS